MGRAQIISVNPGVKTTGEIGSRYGKLARISRTIAPTVKTPKTMFYKELNLLFGLNKGVNTQLSVKLLLLRVVCGALMVLTVLLPMTTNEIVSMQFAIESMVMCLLGVSLLLGFLSRITSYAGVAWSGYNLVTSIMNGTPDMACGALMLLMLVFSVLGPGMFSADQLIRKSVMAARRTARQHRGKVKHSANLDYRAFSQVEHRIS